MTLTFVETDSCSDAELVRRIPDDYQTAGRTAVTDFGSRATKTFEIRSTGTAPLRVTALELSAVDPEFSMRIHDVNGMEMTLPLEIPADLNANSPPGAIVEVAYASNDAEPDLVDLIVRSDDPEREEVKFGLAAGRGQLKVCVGDQCDSPAIAFGNVPIGGNASQSVTISNTGEGDLEIHGITLASDSPEFCAPEATSIPDGVADCSLINLCRVLKPGETYTVNVSYSPANGGTDTGVITIVSGDAARGAVEVPINAVGAGPAVCACLVDGASCNPAPLVDFGLADVGASVERTIRLVSCGTDAVEITEAVLETMAGPYLTGPEFTITTAFTTGLLQPNEFSEGVISYRPTAGGDHRGGLRYVISQNNIKSWIALSGRAATCDLAVLPASVSFGTVGSGGSADRVVTLSNNGVRDCTVTAITDPTNGFTLVNAPQLPYTVGAGQFYDLRVRYTAPQRPSPVLDTSSFIVTANEPSPNQDNPVMLSANGGGMAFCDVQVQPSGNSPISMRDGLLQFNAVNIGYSKTLAIRVTNVGTSDCTFQSFTLATQATNQIVVTPTSPLPAAISAGNSMELQVTFTPTGPGPAIAIPPGTYGSLQNHIDFVLSGAGLMQTDWSIGIRATPTIPTIDVLPDSLDFGVVTWQNPGPDNRSMCSSQERQVNIYNSGTGALDIMFIQVDATSDQFFDITGVTNGGNPVSAPYAFTIQPGGSASVVLRFFPTRTNPGPHHGLLLIENSVTGSGVPLTVPLTGEGTANSRQTDVFQQLTDNKIDILWVVDDSGSMSEEQNLLANNFAGFINFADQQGVDYQVGVITTEINDAPAGKLWACNGFNKIIRSTDANRVAAFQCAANVTSPPMGNSRPNPLGSDEAEAGLQAARLALDSPIRDNENAGFLRTDARLAVIMVSDEEDQSPGSTQLYNDFFRNIKGWANPQLVSVSAIAGDVPNGCATAVSGARYLDVVQHLGGQFESVCSQSWNTLLMNIGIGVFTLRTAWTLSRPADVATITARVGGNPVAQNATNGWTFDIASNTVTFHGSSIPPPGSQIEIQYNAVCNP